MDIARFLVQGPFFASLIAADRAAKRNPLCRVPRSVEELSTPPDAFFKFLQKDGVVPADATFRKMTVRGASESEPDKCAGAVRVTLEFQLAQCATPDPADPAPVETRELFVKLPSVRATSVLIKALHSVFAPEAKEVACHGLVLPAVAALCHKKELPFTVPRHVLGRWSRAFDRCIVVSESVDTTVAFRSIPDWQGIPPAAVRLMLDAIAPLHAVSWRCDDPKAAAPTMHALWDKTFLRNTGHMWLDGLVKLYAKDGLTAAEKEVWAGIAKALAKAPVCISHGDYRPGNMLFARGNVEPLTTTPPVEGTATEFPEQQPDLAAAATLNPRADIVMTDWEANSTTPFLWDATYAISLALPPAMRRRHDRALLQSYLDSLRTAIVAARAERGLPDATDDELGVPGIEAAMEQHKILAVCILYFGWVLTKLGGVGKTQGNSDADGVAWTERMVAVGKDALQDEAAFGALVGVSADVVRTFRDEWLAREPFCLYQ